VNVSGAAGGGICGATRCHGFSVNRKLHLIESFINDAVSLRNGTVS